MPGSTRAGAATERRPPLPATGRQPGSQPRAPLAAAPQTPPADRATTPGSEGRRGQRASACRALAQRAPAAAAAILGEAGILCRYPPAPRLAAAPHGSCSPAPNGREPRSHCHSLVPQDVLGDVVSLPRWMAAILVLSFLWRRRRVSPQCPHVRGTPLPRATVLPGAMFALSFAWRYLLYL